MNHNNTMKNVAPGVPVPYYSQCDSKGRCIRHPTVQMSRKKKLGGWKTIQSICPMCAMEMIANEVPTAPAADVDVRGRREQPASSRKKSDGDRDCAVSLHSHNGSRRNGGPPDDNKSVRSAPSAYPRHPRPPLVASKRSTGELSVSSSDSTADMSYSSSSEYSLGGGGGYYHHRRRSDGSDEGSHRSGGSRRSHGSSSHRSARSQQGSLHSAHGSAARRPLPQGPYIGHVANNNDETNDADADQEEFVCGMKLSSRGCYYTGQIHARTRLPHGLGSLRDDADGSVVEGEWHYGRLVRESHSHHAAPPPPPAYRQEYENNSNDDRGRYEDDDGLCDRFSQHAAIHDVQEGYETEDGSASSVSNSVAETLDDNASQSSAEWSRASGKSQGSAYSARESKGSLPPPSNCSNDVTSDKLQEYERYVERCDEDGDYYYRDGDHGGMAHAGHPPPRDCDRQRKVRFREDP